MILNRLFDEFPEDEGEQPKYGSDEKRIVSKIITHKRSGIVNYNCKLKEHAHSKSALSYIIWYKRN